MADTTGLELRELQVFLVCAEELHFGRTAERLHITPSRVSQTIAKLERSFGVRLFERTSRRVELTSHGAHVRDLIGPKLRELQAALADASTLSGSVRGSLRVGFFGLAGGSVLPLVASKFHATHPEASVRLVELTIADPVAPRRPGAIDSLAGWVPPEPQGVRVGPVLFTETRLVALASGHPLATRKELAWEDLAGYPMARPAQPSEMFDAIIPPVTPGGRPLRREVPVETPREVLTAIMLGQIVHPTIASLTREFSQATIVTRPLSDAQPLQSVLITREEPASPLVSAFLAVAEQMLTCVPGGGQS